MRTLNLNDNINVVEAIIKAITHCGLVKSAQAIPAYSTMALAQSQPEVINRLRKQFLVIADDEQSKRIIRPCPIGPAIHDDEDFNYILERIESPPVPINVLEDGELTKRLNSTKDRQDILEETEEEDFGIQKQFEEMHQKSMIESVKNSVATLKINGESGAGLQRKPPPASSKYFSKLFKSSSSNSTLDAKGRSSESQQDSDDDDDDDDDDDLDDDNFDGQDDLDDDELSEETASLSIRTDDDPSLISVDLSVEDGSKLQIDNVDDETAEAHQINRSGIFVDRHTSDVNAASQNELTQSKYLYVGDNTPSSGDDDLLLDSDFSDENGDILDTTFESSELQLPYGSRSSAKFTPSRYTSSVKSSRKLSFDKTRPRARSRRSDSLVPKTDQSTHNESHSMKSEDVFDSPPKASLFEKVNVESAEPVKKSKLSLMIKKTTGVDDPLDYYSFVSAKDLTNRYEILNLKVYLPGEKQTTVKIRKNVKVVDVIGYVLLTLTKNSPDLLKDPQLLDPNRWCMKLIDEDGEPYEGSFGLMDRTKGISSYGEDEVALIPVSEVEFKANQLQTPTPNIEEPSSISSNSSPQKATGQNSYYKSIIPIVDNDIKDSRTVEIYIYDYPASANPTSFIKFEFQLSGRLNEVMTKYCKAKALDQNDYVLKVIGEDSTLDLNEFISSLDGGYRLEILTKRKARGLRLKKTNAVNSALPTINSNLTPQTLVLKTDAEKGAVQEGLTQPSQAPQLQRTTSLSKFSTSITKHSVASSFRHKNTSKTSLRNQDSMLPNSTIMGYQNFTVWRRQPMSFMNRHERTFAIDGDYIYITPNDERNWYETNFKRTTIHVSQLISCKVSRRISTNFKMLVMKTKGPKRYDFEAVNAEQASEIIKILKTLMRDYRINSASVH